MPITYNAQVSNSLRNAPSATHPYGVGTGFTPSAPDRSYQWAGKQDGVWAFRETTRGSGSPGIQGSNTVRMHQADANGVFNIRIGNTGDALTLKIDYENKTWRVDRQTPDGAKPVDPQGLIDRERANVGFYVASLLQRSGLEKGPSVPAEIGVQWKEGRYHFTDLRPSTTTSAAATAQTAPSAQSAQGYAQTSQMDPSLPSMAGQISTQVPAGGSSPLDVRMSAADKRAGNIAELERASLTSLGLPKSVETNLLKMADKVAKSVDQGSWISLARYADPDHKKTQTSMGIKTPQYVAELLGLNSVDNNLSTNGISADTLSMLKDISFTRAERTSANVITLFGEAQINDGSGNKTLRTQIDVDISNPAKMKLTGAVG